MADEELARMENIEAKYNKIYLAVIERYRDYIEGKESISVAELPTLVTPKSEAVIAKAEEIKKSFANYDYDTNFQEAGMKAFEFVKANIEDVVLPLQFWLTPTDTLSFMMGDTVDKNVLLCSLLLALGNHSTKVLMHIRGGERIVFVYYVFENKICVLDLKDAVRCFADLDDMLKAIGISEESTAYEFNDQQYRDIA